MHHTLWLSLQPCILTFVIKVNTTLDTKFYQKDLLDTSYSLLPKCPSLNKQLEFNGNHYTYWKQKMKDFVEATYIDMQDIVENGYELPNILIDSIA